MALERTSLMEVEIQDMGGELRNQIVQHAIHLAIETIFVPAADHFTFCTNAFGTSIGNHQRW